MNELFSERFRAARVLNGLSLQDLADKLNNKVSRQALHKYEKGEVIPDSEMIALLSQALNVRPDFFSRSQKVELGPIEFRKGAKLPAKEEGKLVEQVRDKLARYLELEEILNIKSAFKNPISKDHPIDSLEGVEAAAQLIRKDWKLGCDPIANCIDLLEDHHIKVIEVESDEEFDGMQTWVNVDIPVIAINKARVRSADRKRFTALHELAHLLLTFGDVSPKQKEKLCHQFAAALLLPKETLEKELGKSRSKLMIPELGAIKQQYGISMQAIVVRCKDIGIITESYYKQFFFLINQMGWRKEEPVTYQGLEHSNRFEQLIFRALAEELISVSKAAALNNQTVSEFQKNLILAV